MGETLQPVDTRFIKSLRVESRAERLTGAAGDVVLREIMERSGIVDWMVPQLTDPRRQEDVVHDLASLIRTSVLLAAQGWRDHDDADALRDDPAFRLAVSSASGRTPLDGPRGLASQPTLSRFTAIMAEPSNRSVLRAAALELAARGARAERGGKGRLCHRWWPRGQRPPGVQDQRHEWAHLFGAARPGGEAAFALVLPIVNTEAMQVYLDRFAETLAEDEHAAMVLDGAGWHGARALRVPPNVTLVPLPHCSPQLNPMERVWLYLREQFLSLRLLEGYDAIVGACCIAWNAVADDAERIRSLCLYPYIQKVIG